MKPNYYVAYEVILGEKTIKSSDFVYVIQLDEQSIRQIQIHIAKRYGTISERINITFMQKLEVK